MKNPYKELSPYIESDAHSFKGRSSETEEMYESFDRNEYLVCHADSGEGKSSIIEAGLIPKMKANCYFPVRIIFKSDEHFKKNNIDFDNVVCGIIENEIEKLRSNNSISVNVVYPRRLTNSDDFELTNWEKELVDSCVWLKLRYERVTIDNLLYTPVLIFDQFEEVFTNPLSQEWTDKFFKWLQELSTDLCPQRIITELEKHIGNDVFPEINTQKYFKAIFSLRSEYVGKLDYWGIQRHYIPMLKNNRYLLRPLTIKGAKEVVTGQDGYDGLNDVADDIIDTLRQLQKGKNFVMDESSELPCIPALFLSIVCSHAFNVSPQERSSFVQNLKRQSENDRESAIYTLIEGFYEKAIAVCDIPPKDMGVIEDVLVNNEGSRQRVSSHADPLNGIGFSTLYMEKLKKARLIRVIPEYNKKDDSIELVHDALCPIIAKRKEQRLAAEAKEREERLLKEQAKKMRKRLSLFALFAIVAIGLVSIFLWQQKKASDADEKAQAYKAKNVSIQKLKAIVDSLYENLRTDSILLASHLSRIQNDSVSLVSKNDSLQQQIIINQQKDKTIERLEAYIHPRIEHNKAGELSKEISSDIKYLITSLSISGQLNGTDIALLREMIINGSLKHLDMENAQIVRGGDAYYNGSKIDKDNVVGNDFFADCTRLLSINIPHSITSIEIYAFSDCYSLTSINIPSSVTTIGYHAFSGCSGLTSINIPNSVTSIGDYAFQGCRSLTSINIPNSVRRINNNAFQGCSRLTSINIPNSVTSIGNEAFRACGLTSINIPNSVTSIGDYAFWRCRGLTTINIPNSVTSLGIYALSDCSALTSINIPNSVTSIGDHVFSGCRALTSINIPNSVTSIGNEAFRACGLTSIKIPNSVTSIGSGAFKGCIGLISINIPNSVTSISGDAFYGCRGLTSINIPNTVTSISGGAFSNCSVLTSINIPNSVTSIGNNAFSDCIDLTSINIPNSVTSIGFYAFGGCSGIVEIKSQIKDIDKLNADKNAFGYRDDLNWIVPVGPNQDKDMYVKKYKEQSWWNEKWTIKHE